MPSSSQEQNPFLRVDGKGLTVIGMDVIKKDMKISEIIRVLTEHSVDMPFGWEIALNMLISECDHLEVHGFGHKAYFTQVMD